MLPQRKDGLWGDLAAVGGHSLEERLDIPRELCVEHDQPNAMKSAPGLMHVQINCRNSLHCTAGWEVVLSPSPSLFFLLFKSKTD